MTHHEVRPDQDALPVGEAPPGEALAETSWSRAAAGTVDVFRRVVERARAELDAHGAVLFTGDLSSGLELVATIGFDAADVEPWRHIGTYEPLPLAECLRHNRRVAARGPEERAVRYPALARGSSAADATACVPLQQGSDGSTVVGVLGVAFRGSRTLDDREWALLDALAAGCVAALGGQEDALAAGLYGPAPDLRALRDPDRLARYDRLGLDEGDPGEAVRRLTHLTSRQLGLVRAQVSLIGADVRVAASAGGPPATSLRVPWADSPCSLTVASGAALAVADARRHPWLRDLPPVREGRLQRYLGVPLVEVGGFALGTLCVYDDRPGPWPEASTDVVTTLADAVVAQFELRATRRELSRVTLRMGRLQALTEDLSALRTAADVADAAARHALAAGAARAWLGGTAHGGGPQRTVAVGTAGLTVTFAWEPGSNDVDAQFAPAERLIRQAGLRAET